MSHIDSEVVDKNKLTQRELLILLTDNVERINNSIKSLGDEYISLHVRVSKIETKYKVVSAAFGVGSVLITIIINLLIYLK